MRFLEKYSTWIIASILSGEIVLAFLVIKTYFNSKRKTLYSYRNASLIGGSFFMVIMLLFSVGMLFKKISI